VLAEFSGYIAADELYDGPFCVLSIVDNRAFHRLVYEVLDHNPTADDIQRFFRRFRRTLDARGLAVRGITTDGSPLYPEAIGEIFPEATHQLCEFHVLAELTKAILKAVAAVRREVRAAAPSLPRGRPTTAAQKAAARRSKRAQSKNADLFDHRHLFVKRRLTPTEQKTLARLTRGMKALKVLRPIMDEVYRLFDRRCRTETAQEKLAALRRRVGRFKAIRRALRKVFSPNIEKALTFLNDDLLPATSNAVERANRRHRKMQKSVYRVRTRSHIETRIALDMLRDDPTALRALTTSTLHRARAG